MRIALTGATGFVGSWLAEELVEKGHEVTCLVRPTSNLRWLRHLAVRTIIGDVTRPESLGPFVEGQDILLHVAGLTKARTEEEYFLANTASTRNLLEAAVRAGSKLKRFVLISSQAAAGPSQPGVPRREEDPPAPLTAYGRSKLAAEKITLEFRKHFPVTVLRPPAVYGPRDRDVFAYFQLAKRGLLPVLGKEGRLSVAFVHNLTYGIRLAMAHPEAENETFFLADEGTYTWRTLGGMIAAALGRRAAVIPVPMALIRAAALLSQAYGRIARRAVLLNQEKLLEIRQQYWTLSTEKAKRKLGYTPPYSTAEAIRITAQWYRQHGWL